MSSVIVAFPGHGLFISLFELRRVRFYLMNLRGRWGALALYNCLII